MGPCPRRSCRIEDNLNSEYGEPVRFQVIVSKSVRQDAFWRYPHSPSPSEIVNDAPATYVTENCTYDNCIIGYFLPSGNASYCKNGYTTRDGRTGQLRQSLSTPCPDRWTRRPVVRKIPDFEKSKSRCRHCNVPNCNALC